MYKINLKKNANRKNTVGKIKYNLVLIIYHMYLKKVHDDKNNNGREYYFNMKNKNILIQKKKKKNIDRYKKQ